MKFLLQADSVVSSGFSFRLVFNWWEILALIVIIISLVYLIKRKRNQ
jgi:hypothetical protein